MDEQRFTDLAQIVIYHYCDVLYKKKAHEAAERLGIDAESSEDADKAYEEYEQMVIDFAAEHLPSDFTVQYDYWGAKCIDNHSHSSATKNGLYAGDASGRIMFFDDFDALNGYTMHILAQLNAGANPHE